MVIRKSKTLHYCDHEMDYIGRLSLLVGESGAAVLSRKADLKALLTDPARGWSKETILSFPDSDTFTNATTRWTIVSPPTYSAAISPGTEQDVVKAVRTRDHLWGLMANHVSGQIGKERQAQLPCNRKTSWLLRDAGETSRGLSHRSESAQFHQG